MNLDFKTGCKLIKKCFEEEKDEKLWSMWLTIYPNMNSENFISYEDFKNQSTNNTNQENLTTEEIEEKVENIINLTL